MRLLRGLILSLAIHLLTVLCLSLIRVTPPVPPDAVDHFIEFVEAPKPRNDREQAFTRKQTLPAEMLREDDPNARRRFASQERQTVLEETRAAQNGLTKNRSETLTEKKDQKGALVPEKFGLQPRRAPVAGLADGDLDVGRTSNSETEAETGRDGEPIKFPNMQAFGLERGRSTFGEIAPSDLKLGQMTALNTDRFLYYSFYERAQDLVYSHWAKYVRAVLYTYQQSGAATGDEYWTTRIEIVLDRQGKFLRGLIHQGSGNQGLDLAPIHAFRDARQIPHPPPEMVKDDGTVRMDWEFAVQMVPQYASGR